MRSSKRRFASFNLLALLFISGCATQTQDAAYRARLEAGVSTPEDQIRYRTTPAQWDRMVSGTHEGLALQQGPIAQQLFSACASGDMDTVKRLLAKGAQPNAADAWGNTPLVIAAREGHQGVARALLSARADPNSAGAANTPLAAAALRGHTPMVRLLLSRGASVNAVGMNGKSPLLIAVELNQIETVEVLLRAGADVEIRTDADESLVMVALNANQPALLSLLLRHGANPNSHDADGLTPLYWARLLKRPEMESALLAAGAKPEALRVVVRKSQPYVSGEYQ
jgi:ankyrin repeat protein